jgi:hypothetical protein
LVLLAPSQMAAPFFQSELMPVPAKDRPTYLIRLRAEPSVADPVKALRGALKILLRQFGLRALDAREETNNDD